MCVCECVRSIWIWFVINFVLKNIFFAPFRLHLLTISFFSIKKFYVMMGKQAKVKPLNCGSLRRSKNVQQKKKERDVHIDKEEGKFFLMLQSRKWKNNKGFKAQWCYRIIQIVKYWVSSPLPPPTAAAAAMGRKDEEFDDTETIGDEKKREGGNSCG